jgi:hypothetical protein
VQQTSLEHIFLRIAATKDEEASEEKDVAPSGGNPVLVQLLPELRSHGQRKSRDASDVAVAASGPVLLLRLVHTQSRGMLLS